MIKFGNFAVALALIASSPALAQSAPAPAAAGPSTGPVPVDPARLVLAKHVIETLSPPAKRGALIESVMRPMMANIQHGFEDSSEFQALFAENPQLRDVMLKFIEGETERSIKLAQDSMPAMYDAMAAAYARRFSTEQLSELQRFFETPTGRAYGEQAATIMSDPDVMAAQRAIMAKSLDGLQDRVRVMAQQLIDMAKKKKGKS